MTFLFLLSGGGTVGSGIKLATIAKNMTPEKNYMKKKITTLYSQQR